MIKQPLLALKITTIMILIRLGLRWLQLPRLLHFLQSSKALGAENLLEFQRVVYYTDRILKAFPYNEKGNCLPRSLMLYALAPRYGYRVKFHCGVRKAETGLDGHAWLTVNGKPFWEPSRENVGMVETFSYPQD